MSGVLEKDEPTTVLHVRVVTGAGGGPDKTVLRSPGYVDPTRYRLVLAYLHPAGDPGIDTLREQAAALGCEFHAIPERGPMDLSAVRALLGLCREQNVRIWHGHDYKSDLLGLALRGLNPMKLVTTVHGFTRETRRTRLYAHADNLALLGYDRVLAVSPPLVDHCRRLGVSPDRVTYLPNGIEPTRYTRRRETNEAKRAMGAAPATTTLGVVSRLSSEKGVARAVRLVDRLPGHVHLHVIGDGPQRGELEAMAGGRVHFHGWRTDARPWLEAMDALLLPSHTEGLPNSVLEAMAMGVPVAATAVGGVPDLLGHGRCGVLLDDDATAWDTPVAALLGDPQRRSRLAEAAREQVARRFTFERRMAKVVEAYDELLGATSTAAA